MAFAVEVAGMYCDSMGWCPALVLCLFPYCLWARMGAENVVPAGAARMVRSECWVLETPAGLVMVHTSVVGILGARRNLVAVWAGGLRSVVGALHTIACGRC